MPEEAPWNKIRVRDAGYNLLHNNSKKTLFVGNKFLR